MIKWRIKMYHCTPLRWLLHITGNYGGRVVYWDLTNNNGSSQSLRSEYIILNTKGGSPHHNNDVKNSVGIT